MVPRFKVLMYIDTSASMGNDDLKSVIGDIVSVYKLFKKSVNFEFWLIETDVGEKSKVIKLDNSKFNVEELKKVFGNGGTDFTQLIELLKKQKGLRRKSRNKRQVKAKQKEVDFIPVSEFNEAIDVTIVFSDFSLTPPKGKALGPGLERPRFHLEGLVWNFPQIFGEGFYSGKNGPNSGSKTEFGLPILTP